MEKRIKALRPELRRLACLHELSKEQLAMINQTGFPKLKVKEDGHGSSRK